MMRFLGGAILGIIAGGVVLAVLAIVNPLPDGPISGRAAEPGSDAPAAEAGSEAAMTASPETPSPTEAPAAPDGPTLASPEISDSAGAGLSTAADSSPARIALAPSQATGEGNGGAAAPAVDTESAAVPEIGGPQVPAEPDYEPRPLVAGTAMAANSVAFNGDTSRPLMSIVLIDEGADPNLRSGLVALSSPITFGVSANIPDVTEVADLYAKSGYEVVAVLPGSGTFGLTDTADPAQVEGLLGAVLEAIPDASSVMDPIGGPLPQSPPLTDAVIAAMKVTGHGLLSSSGSGQNPVPGAAVAAGVPASGILQVIDEQPGSANIALALERAVLEADRSGRVVVVGRVRPETVTTLFSWLLGSGAKAVTIAPVSAILKLGEGS